MNCPAPEAELRADDAPPIVREILFETVRYLVAMKRVDYTNALRCRVQHIEGMMQLAERMELEEQLKGFLRQHHAVLRTRLLSYGD